MRAGDPRFPGEKAERERSAPTECYDDAGRSAGSDRSYKMRLVFATLIAAALFGVPFLSGAAQKQPGPSQQHPAIASFAVGPDQTVTYPKHLTGLSDEHTTFLPHASGYLVFGAASNGVKSGRWGAVVLQTTNLRNFTFAKGYKSPVLRSPNRFTVCDGTHDTEFDENYAAPGSVVQDPTLPAGNLIMIYGSEQHCPTAIVPITARWNRAFYGSVGFVRSSDNGRKWPAPENGVSGGPNRYPILQASKPQPTAAHTWLGDVIPAAFVEKSKSGDYYVYVAYDYFSSGRGVRVARAKLGAGSPAFLKWYNGSFSQPGIGGLDSAVLPSAAGCAGLQANAEISYNDDLGLYLMVYVCVSGPTGKEVGAWYYSTATSLDLEDWTRPQKIQNSQRQFTAPCPGQTTGQDFDGNYPSTISPGAAPGHTKLTGYIFFLSKTCDLGKRRFEYRTFTITTPASTPVPSPIIKFSPPGVIHHPQ